MPESRGERIRSGQYGEVILERILEVLNGGGKVSTGPENAGRRIFDGSVPSVS